MKIDNLPQFALDIIQEVLYNINSLEKGGTKWAKKNGNRRMPQSGY
ncbi:MAG: hypothetical protein LBD18_01160 [Treponema sp.]|jgi:hypothetical protein|nr:hypothetical protein [Treponema sp.]